MCTTIFSFLFPLSIYVHVFLSTDTRKYTTYLLVLVVVIKRNYMHIFLYLCAHMHAHTQKIIVILNQRAQ